MIRRIALIDIDLLVYRCSFAHERQYHWGGEVTSSDTDLDGAIAMMDELIEEYLEAVEAIDFVVALSCPTEENFRKELLPSYKENRSGSDKPALYSLVKEHVKASYTCYQKERLEGDDVLGILATHPRILRGTKVIVSYDKDMLTIPTRIYTPPLSTYGKPESKTKVTRREAAWNHMFQTLTGDSVDNYKGCPGVGPVGATKILAEGTCVDDWWPAVVETYESKGLTEEDALLQARMARILRAEDYDFERREPILWTP